MKTYIPVFLKGNSLGERHHYLNLLVREAHENNVLVQTIADIPEETPVDRIFKIFLASKHRDVDYIIKTLKDEDMLYVSKALKSYWLLDDQYSDIINPIYLEDILYPDLTTTAVNKMKHWIRNNLKDSSRSELFYNYYKNNNFNNAIPFLPHCSKEFVLSEVTKILDMLTPHYLKRLYERHPFVAKLFIEGIKSNPAITKNYLDKENKYFKCLRGLLKIDPELYLDYIEGVNYSNSSYPLLGATTTKYIVNNHRDRFKNKPELYITRFLNIKTLCTCLNNKDTKDIIIKLARAKYIEDWFSYQRIEPFIKNLSPEERKLIKKQVFVDKCVGTKIEEWPYQLPSQIKLKIREDHIFKDNERLYEQLGRGKLKKITKRVIKKKIGKGEFAIPVVNQRKSLLDMLFDRYRFDSFEYTFFELRKKITAESSIQNREFMMLVLVSKSGGREHHVEAFLQFLTMKHANEPSILRAAIVRSLVRRACVWRLSQSTWHLLLQFAHDLGLDGNAPVADCREGIHAVVLRHLLAVHKCDSKILSAYFRDFSTLKEYSLNFAEISCVTKHLPLWLLHAADTEFENSSVRLHQLFNVLYDYQIRFSECPGIVNSIIGLADRDFELANPLLQRLYNAHFARKELIKQNFELKQNDQSYLNALKHDPNLIRPADKFLKLLETHELHHDKFLIKLAIYFREPNGLADQHLAMIDKYVLKEPYIRLGRPMAILAGCTLPSRINDFDKRSNKIPERCLAASLRVNAHTARPSFDLDLFGWKKAGLKAIENRVIVGSTNNMNQYIENLKKLPRASRLCFLVSQRIGQELLIFETLRTKRPRVALKLALPYLQNNRDAVDNGFWLSCKVLIENADLSDKFSNRLCRTLSQTEKVPSNIKTEYCLAVFTAFRKISREKAMPLLCTLVLNLPNLDEMFVITTIEDFFQHYFVEENVTDGDYDISLIICLYVRLIVKFMLLSSSESQLQYRIENVGDKLFNRMRIFWERSSDAQKSIAKYVDEVVNSLRYTNMFLNNEYHQGLNVFQYVITKLKEILPIDQYFGIYVHVHLTILYYKSIRQCLKNNPEYFENDEIKANKAVEVVGRVFGKYLAHEVNELQANFFMSIKELYKVEVYLFIMTDFGCGSTRKKWLSWIVQGLIEENQTAGHDLALYIYQTVLEDDKIMYLNLIKTLSEENKFFLFANKYFI